jgi:hypothetical protein
VKNWERQEERRKKKEERRKKEEGRRKKERRKEGKKERRKEGKTRDGIQTAELDRRDQVTATVPGPVPFERGEQRSITR